ncbi:hypothetical protein HWV62_33219 [Athelia sp. TMB]|nr:hypothetical protein HWV62_33219 [Athelia sp. TMB]
MRCRKCNQLHLVFKKGPIISYPQPPANLLLSHALLNDIEEERRKSSIEAIKALLSQVEERVTCLDTLFVELKKEQDRCVEERRRLAVCMRAYESVNAPVKRASDDVLAEIFTAYTAANPHSRYHLPAPMVLAGVCRRWRDVCTSTPSVWSSISIRADLGSRYESKANIFRMFASRAGTSPLQVAISEDLDNSLAYLSRHVELVGLQLLIDEMAASAWRWHIFTAKCSWALLMRIWNGVCKDQLNKPLSMLQRLSVSSAEDASTSIPLPAPFDLSSMTPGLRHAQLGPGTALLLPWNALESWGGVLGSPQDFMDVLTKCPNLSQCTSLDFYGYNTLAAAPAPLYHQKLHTLAFSFRGGGSMDFLCLFGSLVLPALRDLRVKIGYYRVWAHRQFSNFLDRSSCALQRLVFNPGANFAPTSLIETIALVPSLTEFEFVESRLNDNAGPTFTCAVLHALTRDGLLSNLRTLSLIGRLEHDLPDALIPMLRARAQPASALQALFLQLHPHDSSDSECGEPSQILTPAGARGVQTALADTALQIVVVDDDDATYNSVAFPPALWPPSDM